MAEALQLHRSGLCLCPQVWIRSTIACTCITNVAHFPSPGLQAPDHMCAPKAWGSVGLGGWGQGGVVFWVCFFLRWQGFFFCLVWVFMLFALSNDFKLSWGKLAALLILTEVKLTFFVNTVSSVAGRNRPALVRHCAFFVPRVPELCSGRLAAPGEDIRASVCSSCGLARPGCAPHRLSLSRVRRAPPS